ncbi:MAG: DUF6882 domain-containing protein [Chloroflexota bacterium]
MPTLDSLTLKYGAAAYERQVHFADIVGDAMPSYKVDLNKGILTLNETAFAIQLLGTESEATESWLWAWAMNDDGSVPEIVLNVALQIRAFGEENNVPEFTSDDTIPVDDRVSGQRFGLIACVLCDGNAYFRMPYEGGAIFLLIKDSTFPTDERHLITRMTSSFPQFIQNMQIFDHLTAMEHYAKHHNLKVTKTRESGLIVLNCAHEDGTTLRATFDARSRLTQLQSTLKESDA